MLTDEQLAEIRRRKNRFMGQWTGTAGSLAADCHFLLEDRKTMENTIERLEEENEQLRRTDETPTDWILQGDRELRQASVEGDDDSPAAERLLLKTLGVIKDRRPKYGGPKKHFARTIGMINAAFADVLKRPLTEADWAQFMILDKIARYNGPGATEDGPVDIAGYAACLAEVARP